MVSLTLVNALYRALPTDLFRRLHSSENAFFRLLICSSITDANDVGRAHRKFAQLLLSENRLESSFRWGRLSANHNAGL